EEPVVFLLGARGFFAPRLCRNGHGGAKAPPHCPKNLSLLLRRPPSRLLLSTTALGMRQVRSARKQISAAVTSTIPRAGPAARVWPEDRLTLESAPSRGPRDPIRRAVPLVAGIRSRKFSGSWPQRRHRFHRSRWQFGQPDPCPDPGSRPQLPPYAETCS